MPSTGQTSDDFVSLFLDPYRVQGVTTDGSGRRIRGALKRKEPLRLDEVKHVYDLIDTVQTDGRDLRLSLLKEPITDPYTLATGVQNDSRKDTKELTFEILREIVIPEAKSIAPYVEYFQFDAPRYSSASTLPGYLAAIYDELRAELDKPIVLHVCGDTSRIFDELTKLNVDVLSLDFTLTPKLIEAASKRSHEQSIGVGVTKTEPRVEGVQEISALLHQVCKRIGEDSISFIHPACGQRSLPVSSAYEKNVNIAIARDEVFLGESKLRPETATHTEKSRASDFDPRGRFRILVDRESGRIIVSFVDYHGTPKRTIVGNYADKIIHRILSDNLLALDSRGARHLGYLAIELGKAETALHNGVDYRQDQPLRLERGWGPA